MCESCLAKCEYLGEVLPEWHLERATVTAGGLQAGQYGLVGMNGPTFIWDSPPRPEPQAPLATAPESEHSAYNKELDAWFDQANGIEQPHQSCVNSYRIVKSAVEAGLFVENTGCFEYWLFDFIGRHIQRLSNSVCSCGCAYQKHNLLKRSCTGCNCCLGIRPAESWVFPLQDFVKVPTFPEAGAFAAIRKHDIHTGVDLYAPDGSKVCAVERGTVVRKGPFTGPDAESPWWLPTDYIMVIGVSGIVCYGEIEVSAGIKDFATVLAGQEIGTVKRVLRDDKGKPMSMLHLELYDHTHTGDPVWWKLDTTTPATLRNPTDKLLYARLDNSVTV